MKPHVEAAGHELVVLVPDPSLAVDAPYGLGGVYAGADGEQHLQRYLQQPVTIYLGAADTADDTRNNSREQVQEREQGRGRSIERDIPPP